MYSGVPPLRVERVEAAASQIRAIPKSATRGVPGVVEASMRMFAGLMSRWMTPAWWMAARPVATQVPIQAAMAGSKGPCAPMSPRRSPPPT